MTPGENDSVSRCPVDHDARAIWSQQADATEQGKSASSKECPVDHQSRARWMQISQDSNTKTCSSDSKRMDPIISERNNMPVDPQQRPLPEQQGLLSTEREISTIPKASMNGSSTTESGGYWVYPSQQMFFEAMKRKQWSPRENDMKTVVPIHNAVNEQAWNEILQWENKQGAQRCDGPMLVKFEGDSSKITPKARALSLVGYKLPFDRHDWTISRCGNQIDYVIDFYTAKPGANGQLGFFLDVRPKLNSFEGVKMRVMHMFGM